VKVLSRSPICRIRSLGTRNDHVLRRVPTRDAPVTTLWNHAMCGPILIRTTVAKGRTMANGTEDEYAEFDEQAVTATLEASRQPFEGRDSRAVTEISATDGGELELRASCISVTSGNHRVCLKLPLGIGQVCIPLPFDLPNGTAVRACLSIRTKWGIPTGVCVKLYVAGEQIASKCFP